MQEIINPSYEGNTKVTEDVFVVLHTSGRKQSLNGWRVRAPAIIQIEVIVKSVNNIQISFQMKNGSVFSPIFGYHSHGRGHKTKSKNKGCEGLHFRGFMLLLFHKWCCMTEGIDFLYKLFISIWVNGSAHYVAAIQYNFVLTHFFECTVDGLVFYYKSEMVDNLTLVSNKW